MDTLSSYLTDRDIQTQLPENSEVRRIQHGIENALKVIMDSVQAKDSRLVGKLIPVGSYYSELKIGLPDEFDFIYELQTLEEERDFEVMPSGFKGSKNLWRTPKGDPGKRKIFVKNPSKYSLNFDDSDPAEWVYRVGARNGLNNHECVLHPVGVKNSLHFAILDVLREMDHSKLHRYLTVDISEECTFIYGPAITLFFNWNGRFYKNLSISVDLTVAVKAMKWESHFDFSRPHYMAPDSCLKYILFEEISQNGYHLVPNISDRGHIQWKISTSFLETRVLARFPKNSTIKRLIRVVKSVKDQHLKLAPNLDLMKDQSIANTIRFYSFYFGEDYNESFHHLVSSYIIKTSVFSLCGYASFLEWKKTPLSKLYLLILVFMYKAIHDGNLRNFFISSQKLKIPALCDILPGFYNCFHEADDKIRENNAVLPADATSITSGFHQLEREPFDNDAALTIFQITKEHIDEHFNDLWNN
ncbi:uncharacterized protein LOC110240421 [Exaiptasia diaphana]|uniref:Mab-21-like nucleotidyltransferase domain-containing protein n=1 Tax=Exaiptasia diaphana TaxID=2652724 RepID=A0A913XBD8_EXADI|nr:uncharacterized protein LOC110240421 [Exaiptasia diaphana]